MGGYIVTINRHVVFALDTLVLSAIHHELQHVTQVCTLTGPQQNLDSVLGVAIETQAESSRDSRGRFIRLLQQAGMQI